MFAIPWIIKSLLSLFGIGFNFIDYKKIKGTISLYRPSNQKLDFEMKISLSSPIMLIPYHKLIGGLWEISINWQVDEVAYLNKETVYF